jgi:hypothetical protein
MPIEAAARMNNYFLQNQEFLAAIEKVRKNEAGKVPTPSLLIDAVNKLQTLGMTVPGNIFYPNPLQVMDTRWLGIIRLLTSRCQAMHLFGNVP